MYVFIMRTWRTIMKSVIQIRIKDGKMRITTRPRAFITYRPSRHRNKESRND